MHSDNLEAIGYLDPNFIGCVDTRKTNSRYIFLLAGETISLKSGKQNYNCFVYHRGRIYWIL